MTGPRSRTVRREGRYKTEEHSADTVCPPRRCLRLIVELTVWQERRYGSTLRNYKPRLPRLRGTRLQWRTCRSHMTATQISRRARERHLPLSNVNFRPPTCRGYHLKNMTRLTSKKTTKTVSPSSGTAAGPTFPVTTTFSTMSTLRPPLKNFATPLRPSSVPPSPDLRPKVSLHDRKCP